MNTTRIAILVLAVIFLGCRQAGSTEKEMEQTMPENISNIHSAVFAGGCFWCTESDFEKVAGVIEVISGYTGGRVDNPTYNQVCAGGTGHVEAIKVVYDPDRVSYGDLLDHFWRHVDPTDSDGQFVDRGSQYRTVIFYASEKEREQAETSKKALSASGRFDRPIVTEILPLAEFYEAEGYHQNYCRINPTHYQRYRMGSGRDQFLGKIWPDEQHAKKKTTIPDDEQLKQSLTDMQYRVVREDATEPPFDNPYWDNHRAGIYVDIISGEPLFSSLDKFDSGSGWPSFTRPLEPQNLAEKKDTSHSMVRTEVRGKGADSHLGHVFDDGPEPTRLRYCINSASLRFIPVEDLEREGYGQYRELFE